eukprot:s1100_g1.t1
METASSLFSRTFRASFVALLLLLSFVSAAEPSCEAQLQEVSETSALLQTNVPTDATANLLQTDVPKDVSDVLKEAAHLNALGSNFDQSGHLNKTTTKKQPQGPQGMSASAADAVAVSLLLLQLAAVSPVGYYDSVSALMVVLVYLCSVTSVKFFVKDAINHGFAYPACITGSHMVAVCITIWAWGERPRWQEAKAVLPISLLNGASLLTNNAALVFGGLAFVSMIDAMGPFVTFLLEAWLSPASREAEKPRSREAEKPPDKPRSREAEKGSNPPPLAKGKRPCLHMMTIFSVTIASVGSVLCVRGEASTVKGISAMAISLAGLSAVLRSMRAVWQHDILTDKSVTVSPLHLVFWNGFWTFWTTVITMMCTNEGFQGIQNLSDSSAPALIFLFLSIPAAVTLNITQWFAVKKHGALMQNIIGNLNLVTVIAISKAILLEEVTVSQYVGTLLLVAGTILNKAVDVEQAHAGEKVIK